MSAYEGPVCYGLDGWHHAVNDDETPGDRLFLEDDGTYRLAEDGDQSWGARKGSGELAEVRFE